MKYSIVFLIGLVSFFSGCTATYTCQDLKTKTYKLENVDDPYVRGYLYEGKRHYQEALQNYKVACEQGEGRACNALGVLHRGELGNIPTNKHKANKAYHDGCVIGNAESCLNLGNSYYNEYGVKKDMTKVLQLYQRACSSKEMSCGTGAVDACYNLGVLYEKADGVEEDFAKALAYYTEACNAGGGSGCYGLGVLYFYGRGVSQDYAKVAEYSKKACAVRHADGCSNLGYLYKNGLGVKKDLKEADKLYKKACRLGSSLGCCNSKKLNKKK